MPITQVPSLESAMAMIQKAASKPITVSAKSPFGVALTSDMQVGELSYSLSMHAKV